MTKEENKNSNFLTKIIIIFSVIIAAISIYILATQEIPDKPIAGRGQPQGNNSIKIGGEFSLIDTNGEIFSDKDLKGKVSLIYFGFTFCPDICPTSLQKLTRVIETMDKYQLKIQPIFITIDPMRDSKELLKEYLGHFHPKFIGLTGESDVIRDVADKYKVVYMRSDEDEKNYMLDHTAFIYLMNSNGEYVKHFYMSDKEEDLIEYIRIHYKAMIRGNIQ